MLVIFVSISFLSSQDMVEYGYFTYVENDVKIERLEHKVPKAMINVPVVPGDIIKTGPNGRCEIQFNNGTVMRMDKNSELAVETILANTLTSKAKLTTLKLNKGKLYSIAKTYRVEIFQVLIPSGAVKFDRSSTSLIQVHKNQDTSILVERGRVSLKYGKDKDKPQTISIRPGVGRTLSKDHNLAVKVDKPIEFMLWNETINKHYNDIHHGISKVPKPIHRYPRAIIDWAEKWSSAYGEWMYDDLFGYVWRPYHESFAYAKRPFWNAKFENINGRLFLVPDQPWGWAPAHLGTWVWMGKKGWVWIPGKSFHSGVSNMFYTQYYLPEYGFHGYLPGLTFYDYCTASFGDIDMWRIYVTDGLGAWKREYFKKYNRRIKKPNFKNVPVRIKKFFTRMRQMDDKAIRNHLKRMKFETLFKKASGVKKSLIPFPAKSHIGFSPISQFKTKNIKGGSAAIFKNIKLNKTGYHDFNPDRAWARRTYQSIFYSPKHNSVVAPSLKISSHVISPSNKSFYFNDGSMARSSGISGSSSYIGTSSAGSSSSSGSYSGSGRSASSASRGKSSGGSRGGNKKGS